MATRVKNNTSGDSVERRRLIQLGAFFVVVILAVIAVVAFLVPKDAPEDAAPPARKVASSIDIPAADQRQVELLSTSLVSSLGKFGIKSDQVNAENIYKARYFINQNPYNALNYFLPRSVAYNSVRGNLVGGSPMDYEPNDVSGWSNDMETNGMLSFVPSNVVVNAESTGDYVNTNAGRDLAATVHVTFTSTETQRRATKDDSSWDGSFAVSQKTFPVSADFIFAKVEDTWMLYDMKNVTNPFTLASWNDSNSTAYADSQFGFTNVDTLKPKTAPAPQPSPKVGD